MMESVSTERERGSAMKAFKHYLRLLGILAVLVLLGAGFFEYYSYIFSRRVKGVIEGIERVQLNVALLQNGQAAMDPKLFSFSVAIRQPDGEIITASAEDRQWAVAQKGQCAEAVFYPYPPWQIMKAGTYFNARLDRLFECANK